MRFSPPTAALAAALALSSAVAAPAIADGTHDANNDRSALSGSIPEWATPSAKVGNADTSDVRRVQVALALRDPSGAARLAADVSRPGSSQRGHFLSAAQFTDRFGPTDDSVRQVRDWLAHAGLTVKDTSTNRMFVDIEGTTGDLERAFGTHLASYRTKISGLARTLTAPENPVTIPRALRGMVSTVIGLDDSGQTIRPQHTAPHAPSAQHCARWWGEQNNTDVPQKYPSGAQSNSLCGYTGTSLRAMYSLGSGDQGSGTTIGIVGAYNGNTVAQDANQAAGQTGIPQLKPGQYTAVLPDGGFTDQQKCDADGWAGEQALDVQSSHAIAPNAKIRYYAAKTCLGGLYDAVVKAVNENAADVLSFSWGNADGERSLAPAVRDQFNSIALQAAIQGQSIVVSTGDAGTNAGVTGAATASFPSSSPWATAVGGTTVGLNQQNKPVVVTGWENAGNTLSGGKWIPQRNTDGSFAGGAGGGSSALYGAPDWQEGVVPASASHGHRAVPDIAALADSYTGFLVGQTRQDQFGLYSFGGTSLAAPVVAGLAADAQQVRGARGGLLAPSLYALRAGIKDVTPVKAGIFSPTMHTLPGTGVPSQQGQYLIDFDTRPQTLQSGPGWDNVTGVGTPDRGFVAALAAK
ncbi:S53 family peptidase [Amycolatopsis circi]|uniref:S53 family peptidase n=1 Tax=Amycolatopsis circi TaxID=871959 RepID=UPI000E223F58|nr:S53 family peptidase [Amycolatopsis circi]